MTRCTCNLHFHIYLYTSVLVKKNMKSWVLSTVFSVLCCDCLDLFANKWARQWKRSPFKCAYVTKKPSHARPGWKAFSVASYKRAPSRRAQCFEPVDWTEPLREGPLLLQNPPLGPNLPKCPPIIPVFQSNCHVSVLPLCPAGGQARGTQGHSDESVDLGPQQWAPHRSTMARLMQSFSRGVAECAGLVCIPRQPRGPVL